ncbi:CRE-USP-3 protein [Caenorhabditis remanei]|uniref:Ubiquitin carboxyl-terminal hydrolase n=1 Tax=Caenorhabditis remanei TaxID=31234 RepID=E3LM82_CAERE|nr:CRE-USP-3 protein [Caenorhabditis remanei]
MYFQMLCSHITAEQCIERVPKAMFQKKQEMEDNNLFLEGNTNRGKVSKAQEKFKTFCDECDNCNKSFMCLFCGRILCGRNDSGHAIEHCENLGHPVVIDCITFELYCYSCDDEVSLDFEPSLYGVLKSLKLLFDREDVIEGGEGPTITAQSSPGITNVSTTFATKLRVAPEKKGSKKKRGKKGKVSPMFDTPFQGAVIIDCTNPPPTSMKTNGSGVSAASSASEITCRPRGLRNIGNTCFMNAVLQALASIYDFREYIMSLPSLEDYVEDEKLSKNGNCFLTDEYRKLLISMSAKNYRDPTAPNEFREAFVSACPRFRGFRQHDSHEFLRYLLDQLNTEMRKCRHLPDMPDDKVTPISKHFEGILQSSVICQTCRNCSNKMDEFMDLSLDVPRLSKARIRLSDCLDLFFQKELLEKGEKPECSKCKSKQTCSKQMFIKKLPDVLCLHIKRFRDNGGKIDTLIEFPMAGLSVDDFLTEDSDEPPCVYDLQSIIVHIGYGCSSGHYIAFGRRGQKWYQFDDTVVKPVDTSLVSKQKAYVLMYTKSTRKP